MINFFKDSVRELKHVVWPTKAETNKYFLVVVITLILFGLYLFIASITFSEALFGLKSLLNGSEVSAIPSEVESVLDIHSDATDMTVEWESETSITVEEDISEVEIETEESNAN